MCSTPGDGLSWTSISWYDLITGTIDDKSNHNSNWRLVHVGVTIIDILDYFDRYNKIMTLLLEDNVMILNFQQTSLNHIKTAGLLHPHKASLEA